MEIARLPPSRVVGVSTYNLVVLPKLPVTVVNSRTSAYAEWRDDTSDEAEASFRRLTHEEAQTLREQLPQTSPWHVIAAQAAVGVVLAALIGLLYGWGVMVWSALYGAAAVVVPGALLARGATTLAGVGAVVLALRFLMWEFVKLGVAILMLGVAPKVVPGLSWPALLVVMVVCIKVNWLALLWRGQVKTRS